MICVSCGCYCVVLNMWRRALRGGPTFIGLRSGGTKALWGFCGQRACSAPALPAGHITALQAVDFWTKQFEGKGVTEPELSSRYIIAYLLGAKTMESLEQQRLKEFLSREETNRLWELCTQRLSRMPVQYVIGEWDFRDLTLTMRPPVFIPRPETEELVELVLTDLQRQSGCGDTVLEVGCGSGAISVSLLKSLPQLKAFALDRSQEAVDLTKENALRYGVQDRLQVHNIDVMKDADALFGLRGSVAVLVSNPPYLFSQDMATLQPEILRFEDHAALDGGEDGLNVIKQILTLAQCILQNQGRVYLEVDPRHPPLIQQWVEVNVENLQYIETRSDICGRWICNAVLAMEMKSDSQLQMLHGGPCMLDVISIIPFGLWNVSKMLFSQ